MELECKYKWREIHHRELYEPDAIIDLNGGEASTLNGVDDYGYHTREEALADLERIHDKHGYRFNTEYVLIECWRMV